MSDFSEIYFFVYYWVYDHNSLLIAIDTTYKGVNVYRGDTV